MPFVILRGHIRPQTARKVKSVRCAACAPRSGFVFFTIRDSIPLLSYYNITDSNLQVHCANILWFFRPKSGNRQFLSFCPLAAAGSASFVPRSIDNYICPHFVIRSKRYCKLFRLSYEFFMNLLLTNRVFSCIIKIVTDCLQDSRFFLIFPPSNPTNGSS